MQPPRAVAVAAAIVVLLCLVLAPAVASAQSTEQQRLAANRAEVAAVRARLAELDALEDNRRASHAEATHMVDRVLESVGAAGLAVERQQASVEAAKTRLLSLETRITRSREDRADRAAELYRTGSTGSFEALLAATSPVDVLDRSRYVDVISRRHDAVLETVIVAEADLDAQRVVLEREEADLAGILEEQRLLLADVDAIRAERSDLLAEANAQIDTLEAQERHLESESRELAALIRRETTPTQPPPAGAPSFTSRGGWQLPLASGVFRYTSGFGRRWGRMHQGVDMAAPTGTAIYASRAGRVVWAGRRGGYGNLVLVDHGGGFVTAYAHQSQIRVSVGQQVGQGDRLGDVGSTGNSTGPHLHFEVRVNGSARDPRGYLP